MDGVGEKDGSRRVKVQVIVESGESDDQEEMREADVNVFPTGGDAWAAVPFGKAQAVVVPDAQSEGEGAEEEEDEGDDDGAPVDGGGHPEVEITCEEVSQRFCIPRCGRVAGIITWGFR